MLDDVDKSIEAVSGSWREFFPDWPLPTIWNGNGLYDSTGRELWSDPWRVGPICGNRPASEFNAIYCFANDTVAWDLQLLENYAKATGTRFISLVIAHEFGHAAQMRLRQSNQAHLVWPAEEWQADCAAGAFLSTASGDGRLDVGNYGVDEMIAGLVAIADAEPWSKSGDHGDPNERIGMFELGVGGIEKCFGPTGPPVETPISSPPADPDSRLSLITPSGNIWCASIGIELKCTIAEFDFPANCHNGGLPLITMDVLEPPTADSCAGLALGAIRPKPVDYGETVWVGAFRCTAQTTGLTCTNDVGHGFELSRAALRLY